MSAKKSNLYTRTGDTGSTRIASGESVKKYDPRIELLGCLDELNSILGVLLCHTGNDSTQSCLQQLQPQLFELGAEVAGSPIDSDWTQHVLWIEGTIDMLDAELSPLRAFILPGGGIASATCHLARAICRRAERRLIELSQQSDNIHPNHVKYLNRLSDLLFVVARALAKSNNQPETEWKPSR